MIALLMAGGKGSRLAMDEEKPLVRVNGRPMISYVMDALLHSKCFDGIVVAVSRNTQRTKGYILDGYAARACNTLTTATNGCRIWLVDTPASGYVEDLNSLLLYMGRRGMGIDMGMDRGRDSRGGRVVVEGGGVGVTYRASRMHRNSDQDHANESKHEPYNVFVTPADLPLLDGYIVRDIVGASHKRMHNRKAWLAVVTSKAFLDSIGISSANCFASDGSLYCYTGISMVSTGSIGRVPATVDEDHLVLDDVRIAVNVNTLEDLRMAESILTRFRRTC
ncbi:MAG: NTP transferase domain-containing protein [Candidatus Nitrosocaldus sp.]|nr:NTP transferase domain-containing protein [Candidatus Nitrosocaldus sp.]MDW8274913.1 NTP transferase domain-containing protein [Candidatus Nitrosocaldus sp.]